MLSLNAAIIRINRRNGIGFSKLETCTFDQMNFQVSMVNVSCPLSGVPLVYVV